MIHSFKCLQPRRCDRVTDQCALPDSHFFRQPIPLPQFKAGNHIDSGYTTRTHWRDSWLEDCTYRLHSDLEAQRSNTEPRARTVCSASLKRDGSPSAAALVSRSRASMRACLRVGTNTRAGFPRCACCVMAL
eukprot:1160128-Pelagomonas_calceolata.AAC.10